MKKTVLLSLLCSVLAGCGGSGADGDTTARDYSEFFTPLPSTIPFPENNPYSLAKEELGELLFWDPVLSGQQNVACASCHHPDFGWADGRNFSIGVDGVGLGPERYGEQLTPIHSPTVAFVAYSSLLLNQETDTFESGPYFWDLRAKTLEEQALGPIVNPIEMRGTDISEADIFGIIMQRLTQIDEYQALFQQAFPEEPAITMDNVAKALATYQRTLVGEPSRFDQFIAGDTGAFSNQEIAGINEFIDAGCARCHSGPMLSDNVIHTEQPVLEGRAAVRTPSLRNISATAPYMHTGERTSLRSAISIYEDRGDLDVDLDDDEIGVIEAFLRTLDTPNLKADMPEAVPSGLPVGGDIH